MGDEMELWAPEGAVCISAPASTLLEARSAVNTSEELQRLFREAREQQWSAAELGVRLAAALGDTLPGESPTLAAVASVLAEEFVRSDQSKVLLVSAQTGQSVASVPATAVIAGPAGLTQLDPQVAAGVAERQHEVAREKVEASALALRVRATDLTRAIGDNRLLVGTRRGRQRLVERLQADLPGLLGEASRRDPFLRLCRFGEVAPSQCSASAEFCVMAYVRYRVADIRSLNVAFDTYGNLGHQVCKRWSERMAERVAFVAQSTGPVVQTPVNRYLGVGLVVASPEVIDALPERAVFSVNTACTALLGPDHKTYVELAEIDCSGHEGAVSWEVVASAKVVLRWDPATVTALRFVDLPVPEAAAEWSITSS